MLTVAQSRKYTVNNIQLNWEKALRSSLADAAIQGFFCKWIPWSKKYFPT